MDCVQLRGTEGFCICHVSFTLNKSEINAENVVGVGTMLGHSSLSFSVPLCSECSSFQRAHTDGKEFTGI